MKLTLFFCDIIKDVSSLDILFSKLTNKLIHISGKDESHFLIFSFISSDNKIGLEQNILEFEKQIKSPIILGKCFYNEEQIHSYINELQNCYRIQSIYCVDNETLNKILMDSNDSFLSDLNITQKKIKLLS